MASDRVTQINTVPYLVCWKEIPVGKLFVGVKLIPVGVGVGWKTTFIDDRTGVMPVSSAVDKDFDFLKKAVTFPRLDHTQPRNKVSTHLRISVPISNTQWGT